MKRLSILLFFILFLGSLYGHSQHKKLIGFLMDDFNSSRWKHDSSIFVQKVRAAGYEVAVRICDSDTSVQYAQALELINAGADVLVIVPANSISAGSIVSVANGRKIPVIAYDRLILNCNLDYYISFDGEKVGELQAEYILKKINYSGSIMIMNGPEYDINSLLFKKGQMNILKPFVDKGSVKIVYNKYLSEWTSMEAYMEANDFLSSYKGRLDGVIAANDGLAQGIIEALSIYREAEAIPVTGQDATLSAYHNILDDLQGMTVYKPIDSLAIQAADLACMLASQKKPRNDYSTAYNAYKNVPFIKLEPIAVTKENIQSVFIKSNYLSDEYLRDR